MNKQEAIKDEEIFQDRLKNILEALKIIGKEKGDQGKIKCPKCANDLYWTRSKNKHIWGKCKTENCLSWLQ